MAFSGVSSQGWGGKRVPVAGSTDWAGLMVHLGPNPNTSGKFPVSSASAWHSHASAASRGSDPRRGSASPLSHLPGTCQVSPLTHDTAEPAPGTGSLRPTAACRASVSPWGRLRSGRTFSSEPEQSRPPCRLARDTLSQRECNVLPAVPHRRLGRARLYKYPSLGTHRTQSPAKSRQRPASLSPAVPPATQRSLPQHPDTRSRPQPLPALRNTRRSHGRLKIKAEKKKKERKGGLGAGVLLLSAKRAAMPKQELCLGGKAARQGSASPLPSQDSPARGRVSAAGEGSGRRTATRRAPGRCHLPALPEPRSLPAVLPGELVRLREENEEEEEEEEEGSARGAGRRAGPGGGRREMDRAAVLGWGPRAGLGGGEGCKPPAAFGHGVSRGRRQKAGWGGPCSWGDGGGLPGPLSGGASAAGWGEQPPVAGAAD